MEGWRNTKCTKKGQAVTYGASCRATQLRRSKNAISDYTAHRGTCRGIVGYQICVRYSTSLKVDEDLLNYDHF